MGLQSNSIPRSIIALLGGRNEVGMRTYVLYKDGEILVIEAPPSTISNDRMYDQTNDWEEWDKEYNFTLEKIQTVVKTVEFGRTNWAYLLPRPDGGCRLIQKERPVPRVTYPTWAPLVEEKDIVTTKWISAEDRQGLWNGREVDLLMMGWDDKRMNEVEQTMKASPWLDLTFEVLAHIVRDGRVIGLMTEPAKGRMVEHCDRAKVFDAISRVESRGLLYRSIHCSNIMISGGKVRLLNISTTRYYSPEQRERHAEDFKFFHWKALKIMFDLIREGNFMTPPRTWPQNLQYIPSPIPPEMPRLSFVRLWFIGTNKMLYPDDRRKGSRTSHNIPTMRKSKETRRLRLASHALPVYAPHTDDATVTLPWTQASSLSAMNSRTLKVGGVHHSLLLPYDSDTTTSEEDVP
ncbi:hypothetical protein ONZ45_g14591 [Pleurotus djamor]|nr:hypothetical protein ONZ45_g14591 [Pleurotus djamor]